MRQRRLRLSIHPAYFIVLFILVFAGCNNTKECTYNVHISMKDQLAGEVVTGNSIEIYILYPDGTTDEKMVSSAVTDENGTAHFCLPKGSYRAIPAGSWVGSTDFSLSTDTQELKAWIFADSILN